ncbi:hypothetical protein THAOC_11095, partial [Thalassiosira oceanica]
FFGSSWGDAKDTSGSSDPWAGGGSAPPRTAAPGSGPSDPWGAAFGSDPFGASSSEIQSNERPDEPEAGKSRANSEQASGGALPPGQTPAPGGGGPGAEPGAGREGVGPARWTVGPPAAGRPADRQGGPRGEVPR